MTHASSALPLPLYTTATALASVLFGGVLVKVQGLKIINLRVRPLDKGKGPGFRGSEDPLRSTKPRWHSRFRALDSLYGTPGKRRGPLSGRCPCRRASLTCQFFSGSPNRKAFAFNSFLGTSPPLSLHAAASRAFTRRCSSYTAILCCPASFAVPPGIGGERRSSSSLVAMASYHSTSILARLLSWSFETSDVGAAAQFVLTIVIWS